MSSWLAHPVQDLRRVGDWTFRNSGWWYTEGIRACFFTDVNVPTNTLAVVEYCDGDDIVVRNVFVYTIRPLAGYNCVNYEEMSSALNEVKKRVDIMRIGVKDDTD